MAGVRQYETNIAIVGAGGAGIAAGIEARDAGARAIVFEKSSEPGGAAIISGGGCLIVGSPLQHPIFDFKAPDRLKVFLGSHVAVVYASLVGLEH